MVSYNFRLNLQWTKTISLRARAIFVSLLGFSTQVQAGTDVLEYHGGDSTSNGVNSQEVQLTPSITVSSFGEQFSTSITDVPNLTGIPTSVLPSMYNYAAPGGQVYGEPLVKTAVNITTGTYQGVHDVVFVVTTMNSLYAIDANGGTVLWKDSFIYNATGNPNPLNPAIPIGVTAVPGAYGTETNSQDVAPWIGIQDTPAIDGVNGYIYFVAKTREAHGTDATDEAQPHYVLTLHKVNLSNGADTSAVIADTTYNSSSSYTYNSGPYVVGTGPGATTVSGQSRIYYNAVRQMVRPAVVLYGGRVYIASASHGDNQPYHGWILTFDAGTLALNGVWNTTPNGEQGEGGVWQGGGGVIIDPATGYIYFMTGNGDFDGSISTGTVTGLDANSFPINGNYGDCIVKLQLDPTTSQGNQGTNKNGWGLKVVDYFAPYNNYNLDENDTDLGSGGPTLLPDSAGSTAHQHLLIGSGKEGKLYLVDRDNMGKFGTTDSVVQTVTGLDGCLSVPAYFNGRIYVSPGYGGNTVSYPLTAGTVTTTAVQTAPENIAFSGSSPYISANGTMNGVMWQIDHGTGELRAYDASNLNKGAIWTSDLDASRDSLGSSVKFTVATPANGHVYVGTSDHLIAYGPPTTPTSPPASPTGLSAVATGPTTISLNWTDNSDNESGFLIERSNDGVNFTQIAEVGVNIITYGDSGLSSQATYYYRVRATNLFNTVSYSSYTNVASATTLGVGAQTPIYLYSFDEGAGTTTIDSISGNNGTLIGTPLPTWVAPGRIGSADLAFSGSGVYNATNQSAVQVTTDLSPVLGTTSSLFFWIKTTQTGNNTHWQAPAVTGVEQSSAGNDINWGYLDATGHICLAVGDSGSVKSVNPINDGNWHHVALTRNATSGAVQVYVDGVLSASTTLITGNLTSHFKLIGALSVVQEDGATFTGANFLNAQLDDVRVYNFVASQSLVSAVALAPAAATNLTVTPASGTELDLAWVDNATNATGYEVWCSIAGGPYNRIAQLSSTATTYPNGGLTQGTPYSYFVRAISLAGSADSSIISSSTPVPPATPSGAMVTNLTPTSLTLTWVDNASNETGYRVLRSGTSGNFVQLAQLPANTTTYVDSTVMAGTTYDYHIQAYNVAGVSDFTGLAVTVPSSSSTPAPVTTLVGTPVAAGNGATLTWVDSTDPTVTGYQIWGSVSGGTFMELAQLTATTNSYPITGLTPGVTYNAYIVTVGTGGSSQSGTISFTTPIPTVTTAWVSDLAWVQVANGWGPVEKDTSNGEIAAGDGHTISIRGTTFAKGLGCHANSQVNVPLNGLYKTFTSSVGIDDEVAPNGSVDFQVFADGTKIYDSGTLTGTSPIQSTGSLNVTGVTTLELVVSLVGANNNYDHADWAGAQVTTTAAGPPPAAVTGTTATATSGTTVNLAWVDSTSTVTGYGVWQSTNGGAFGQIATLASTATSYPVTGLTAGNTYAYYIQAIGAGGSTNGATVSVTTPTTTIWVSDLAWVQIANGWGPVEKDMSNGEQAAGDGHTITIRGTTFAKGLGCHANSQVNVPLNGLYKTFSSSIGIDDEMAPNGAVDFQVIADGTKIYDSGTLTGTSPIQSTGTLNVTGVTTLELIVNYVGANNYYDHSDWAGAQVGH